MHDHLPKYWGYLKGLQSRIDRPFRIDGKTIFDLEKKVRKGKGTDGVVLEMMIIDNTQTFGWELAIKGMRNPYESWDKSDSKGCEYHDGGKCDNECVLYDCKPKTWFCIGEKDMALCKRLINAGSEHRKFLRMIHVQADVTAPRYWWAEMDKYKWVEANSSSTMHLLTKNLLYHGEFSFDSVSQEVEDKIIDYLNSLILHYNRVNGQGLKDGLFREIKQLLPESFNQLRTIDTNYEALLSIHHQRKNHRLEEWRKFCQWIESLPYMKEFLDE